MIWKDLFRPKWKHSEDAIRLAAVRELSDQAALLSVALHDYREPIRAAAAERLVDPRALAEVAKRSWYESPEIQSNALQKLSEGPMLVDVALHGGDEEIRLAAVEKLWDQALLAQVALKSDDVHVRMAAAGKLEDQPLAQSIYAAVARCFSGCWGLCRPAVEKITDEALAQSIYAEVTIEDSGFRNGLCAFERITDRKLLARVALNAKHSEVREDALKKWTNLLVAELAASNRMTALQAFLSRTVPASLSDDLRQYGEFKLGDAFKRALLRQVEADWLKSGTIGELQSLIAALDDRDPPWGLLLVLDTLYRELQKGAASKIQKESVEAICAIREESVCHYCGGDGVLEARTIGNDAPLERDCNPHYLEASECIWCSGARKLVKYGGHWLGLHAAIDPKAGHI